MTISPPRLEWVRPPRQERSQRTLERILEAAEVLFARKGFDDTGVAEICHQAGSSVGAFYARFPDKEALLRQVLERFCEQAVATTEVSLDPRRWEGVPLEVLLRTSLRFLTSVFRERAHLLRAFGQLQARDPSIIGFADRVGALIARRCHELVVARGEAIAHPEPAQAIAFLVWVLLGALEAQAAAGREQELIAPDVALEHMVHMCLAHLGLLHPPS